MVAGFAVTFFGAKWFRKKLEFELLQSEDQPYNT